MNFTLLFFPLHILFIEKYSFVFKLREIIGLTRITTGIFFVTRRLYDNTPTFNN